MNVPMPAERPTLHTARLLLRPFTLADAPEVRRLAGDREVAATTMNVPHPYEEGMAEEWIGTHEACYERGEQVNFAVVLRHGNQLIGSIGLRLSQLHARAELGYWIGRPLWNRGYCTEAARVVVDYGFRDLGLHRIHATYMTRNPASGRVMQKIGMLYEGRLRQHVCKWGAFEDMDTYGLLRDEWGAQVC
jgi:ribosomal-protein-alanine N-acetyltransferase